MCFGYDGEGALRRSLEEKGASRRTLFRGAAVGAAGCWRRRTRVAACGGRAAAATGSRPRPRLADATVPHDKISIQLYTLRSPRWQARAGGFDPVLDAARAVRLREGRAGRLLRPDAPPSMRDFLDEHRHPRVVEPRRHQRRHGGAAQPSSQNAVTLGQEYVVVPYLNSTRTLADWQHVGRPDERRGGGREAVRAAATATTTTPTSSRSTWAAA